MPISCSVRETESISSSPWVSLCGGTTVKGNNGDEWSFDGVMLWLGRRQNGDTVEWWGEWPRLR
jgi:hypothetical protein